MAETRDPHAAGAAAEDASFEAMLNRLEQVVVRLEKGDLALDDSLKAYEEGIQLVRRAQGRLDGMEKRLEQLLADGKTAPLQVEAGSDENG